MRDPFPALSHWFGAALAVCATADLLTLRSLSGVGFAAIFIYGLSLVVLFAASAFAHTRHCSEAASLRLVKLDYAAIFLLIAGTYTPVLVLGVGGLTGGIILALEWLLAAIGTVLVTRGWRGQRFGTLPRVAIYIVMGWLGFAAPSTVIHALGWGNIGWLIAGGVVYTVGAVVFVTDRPRLFPGRFVAHDLWHLMVIAGAACHFAAIRFLVAGR